MIDKKEFDLIMKSTECIMCGADAEDPYEGAVVLFKFGDLISEGILCFDCARIICGSGGTADALD